MSAKFWLVGSAMAILAGSACKGSPSPQPADAAAVVEETKAPAADVAAVAPDAAPVAPDVAAVAADVAVAVADAAVVPAAHTDASVKLIEAGAEPRRAMRYAAKVGAEQVANLAMTTELELGAKGQKMPTPLPKTRMTIGAKVSAADPAGDTRFALTITEADLAEGAEVGGTRAGEKLAEVIRGMKGLSGEKVASARGVSHQFTLASPAGSEGIMATAALKPVVQGFERAIDQMTVPLPDEAIGVGAKWEVAQKVVEAGMTLDQTTTFEVVAVKDNIVSLRFTVVLAAPPGKLESTFAGGMAAEVKSLTGSGEGTIDVDLGQVLPVVLSAKNRIAMSLEVAMPNEKRELDVEMRVTLDVKSP